MTKLMTDEKSKFNFEKLTNTEAWTILIGNLGRLADGDKYERDLKTLAHKLADYSCSKAKLANRYKAEAEDYYKLIETKRQPFKTDLKSSYPNGFRDCINELQTQAKAIKEKHHDPKR